MEIIVAVAIAVVGWVIVVIITVLGWLANHKLTVRAQEENLLNEIMNDARIDVTKAIREYLDWLNKIFMFLNTMKENQDLGKVGELVNWLDLWKDFYAAVNRIEPRVNWFLRMSEYDILFPELMNCQKGLIRRGEGLLGSVFVFSNTLQENLKPEKMSARKSLLLGTEGLKKEIVLQATLMQELIIIYQDLALGLITGGQAVPKPIKEDRARLVFGKDGTVELLEPKASSRT